MPNVALPENDELIRQVVDMLMVLNLPAKRRERWEGATIERNGRAWVPKAQLEERARAIAATMLARPPA